MNLILFVEHSSEIRRVDHEAALRLVPIIYEAGLSDELWPVVAERLSELFGDAAIGIDSRSQLDGSGDLTVSALFDTSLRELHYEGYDVPEANPGVAALLAAPIGRPFEFASFVDPRTYEHDPSIRAILHPQRINKGLLLTLERNDSAFGFLAAYRRDNQSDFETRDIDALAMLSTHIQKALHLRGLAYRRDRERDYADFSAASNRTLEGRLILSSKGRVVEADAPAEIILGLREGLLLRYGQLASASNRSGEDSEALGNFVTADGWNHTAFGITSHAASIITLERLPISVGTRRDPSRVSVVLRIRRIPKRIISDVSVFSATFGLTPAEAKVVAALTESNSAVEAARLLGISRDTIKTHLNRVYRKTETASLSQLMLRIGRFM